MRAALAFLALVAFGCGMGRSRMLVPPSARPDAATTPALPDASPPPDAIRRDARPLADGPTGVDVPPRPDVLLPDRPPSGEPDAPRDLRPADLPSDGLPPLRPDGSPLSDGPPPMRPDRPLEGPPPISPDARVDGPPPWRPEVGPDGPPPIAPDLGPDGPPVIMPDVAPDLLPPPLPDAQPDVRRRRPDGGPPPQVCAAGAACTADCTATCSVIGTMTCTCADGLLSCGTCQLPPITVSPDPCPDNANGADCPTNGLACFVLGSGSIGGACVCLARGNSGSLRWTCLLR